VRFNTHLISVTSPEGKFQNHGERGKREIEWKTYLKSDEYLFSRTHSRIVSSIRRNFSLHHRHLQSSGGCFRRLLIIISILLARTDGDGIAFPKSGFGHFFEKQQEGRKELKLYS